MTLAEFLLARIAEDRIVAAESQRDPWRVGHKASCDWPGDMPGYCSCDATARALAECEAKRRIVELYGGDVPDEWRGVPSRPMQALASLAAVYADHPDYDEAWRP